MEPLWHGGTNVCLNGPGHITKMAAMPIYGKNLKKIFTGTKAPMTLKRICSTWSNAVNIYITFHEYIVNSFKVID